MMRVLLGGDGGDDVAHRAGASPAELRQQRVGQPAGGDERLGSGSWKSSSTMSASMPLVEDEAPSPVEPERIAERRPVEGDRDRRPPVHHDGIAAAVLDMTAPDVPAVAGSPRRCGRNTAAPGWPPSRRPAAGGSGERWWRPSRRALARRLIGCCSSGSGLPWRRAARRHGRGTACSSDVLCQCLRTRRCRANCGCVPHARAISERRAPGSATLSLHAKLAAWQRCESSSVSSSWRSTWASMISTLVTPRGRHRSSRRRHRVARTGRRHRRDLADGRRIRDQGLHPCHDRPLALLAQLVAFLGLFLVGYSIALWPYARRSSSPCARRLRRCSRSGSPTSAARAATSS